MHTYDPLREIKVLNEAIFSSMNKSPQDKVEALKLGEELRHEVLKFAESTGKWIPGNLIQFAETMVEHLKAATRTDTDSYQESQWAVSALSGVEVAIKTFLRDQGNRK